MSNTKYIGLDAHSSSCSLCVLDPQGAELDSKTIVTNGRLLIDYLKSLGGKQIIAFEECDLSCWLFDILHKHVHQVVICNPAENRQYKRAKTDKLDARSIADLLRGGFLKTVFHDGSEREKFRLLMSNYQDTIQETVRIKNRLTTIKRRARLWGDKGKLNHAPFIQEQYNLQLKLLKTSCDDYQQKIQSSVKNFKESSYLMSIPGIAFIQSARIISQVVDPHRFSNKYKLFAYCGLVKHPRISAERKYGSIRIWGNRTLKCVFKMAAHSALRGQNALKKLYESLRQKGLSDIDARNAIARKIAALALTLWKNKQYYNEQIILESLPAKT